MTARVGFGRVGALSIALVMLAACGSSSKSSDGPTSTTAPPATRPTVVFQAHEYGYTGPSVLPTGYVNITLRNEGHQDHQAQIMRVTSTTTIADVQTVANGTDPMSLKGALYVGGPNTTTPGQTHTTIVHLTAGRYAMFCYLPGPGGKAHASFGMVKFFTAADQNNVAPEPQAVASATLSNFNFALPRPLPRTGVLRIDNHGTQVHELLFSRLLPGKTLDDARNFYLASAQGKAVPKPFVNAGGAVGLSPGESNWLDLNLTPGNYVFICFFPDPHKGGLPHALEGMLTVDTVT